MTVSTGIFQPSNRQVANSLSRIHNGNNSDIGICRNLAAAEEAADFIMWDTWAACELEGSGEYATVLYLQDEQFDCATGLFKYVFKTSTGQNLTLEVNRDDVLVLAYISSP